ncbi:MAG: low molecular weight phosphatase family protein [Candidatus Pacearchaeota archaeon]|nr:low molecular weight phosphatase family protein [Candidatus Pacearchaeota archaeon]
MKVLFVCKHNRFRSKVAEAIFNKYNKNNRVEVKSCGIRKDLTRPYVCKNVKDVLEEKGIKIIDEQAREINEQDIKWADKIVVVSNNVDSSIFPEEKVVVWKIEDADESEREKIKEIINRIEMKIKKFIKEI